MRKGYRNDFMSLERTKNFNALSTFMSPMFPKFIYWKTFTARLICVEILAIINPADQYPLPQLNLEH